ncbi:hypothetical protein V6N13_048795 [Hibiscus sabdariffa]|uniref:DUF4378 domain-containing protein n=1 Tax=Hibiscus sabdariffa TaxID=183260 RepID=A0ABR2DIK9_9ROSI
MAQKHLHELLEEDQEPFVLKSFIADRLKKSSHLQIKKPKPIAQTSDLSSNFCKNACFFSFTDPRKSPLFELHSPVKTPNAIFLHIPTRTAALLLEAALRIQKQSSSKTKNKGRSFGLFGSILKRLAPRGKTRKREGEISNDGPRKTLSAMEDQSGRPSSAVWSEKSMDMDMDTSCSCSHQSEDFEEIFTSKDVLQSNPAFASLDEHFCESPFNFVLQKTPSLSHRTPLFSSPTTSPSRRQKEDKENYETENFQNLQAEEEEEEKEQCSPVSVLDPPFEDNNRHMDDDDNNADENDGFDLECSFANVQRAKQQLLHKLRSFEKLAELDPIELEKRMLEHGDDDDANNRMCDMDEEDELENGSFSLESEINVDVIIQKVLKSSFCNAVCLPDGMKRLVSDLIGEEETDIDRETVAKRVCKRLESWKDVESNTIDMMVEQDFRRSEADGWIGNQEQIKETASQLEYAIFGLLLEELSEEIVSLTGI